MEESPVGESASNGEIEAAVKQVEGQVRVLKSSTEFRYGVKAGHTRVYRGWLDTHENASISYRWARTEEQHTSGAKESSLAPSY